MYSLEMLGGELLVNNVVRIALIKNSGCYTYIERPLNSRTRRDRLYYAMPYGQSRKMFVSCGGHS